MVVTERNRLLALRFNHAISSSSRGELSFGLITARHDRDQCVVGAYLDRIEGNGVRTVIVEDASRFARELMAQELGITLLISRGVRLLTASGDDLTASDDATRKMMRQIAGAFAEYEKARLVSKLRHARERVRQEMGKCEGRKAHAEIRPDVVALAKKLRRASPKSRDRLSYRQISARLADLNERGQPFNPKSVRSMLVG